MAELVQLPRGKQRQRPLEGRDLVRDYTVASMSAHADERLAQRNLSAEDVRYVFVHGRRFHAGKAVFVHLGRRDIPRDDLRENRLRRLEGTVLVLDPSTGGHLTTAYRNRRSGCRNIKRKPKRGFLDELGLPRRAA